MKDSEYAFGVCRIEPENNIHVILEAFAGLQDQKLIMVGNWKSSAYGLELLKKFENCANISMIGPIYDHAELNKLRGECTLYLHGHSCGGTNPSLVEAMYLELPIAAFDVNFNRETTENKAEYFKDAAALQQIVNNISDDRLRQNAADMKEIADRRYTWERISQCYADLF